MIIETTPLNTSRASHETLVINGKELGEMTVYDNGQRQPYHAKIKLKYGNGICDEAFLQGHGEDKESAIRNAVKDSLVHHKNCVRVIQDFDWEINGNNEPAADSQDISNDQ